MARAIYLDRFDSTLHLTKRQRTYERVLEVVLLAGRFSCFEASEDPGNFDRMLRDPSLDCWDMGYPWTGVKRKPAACEVTP